MSVLIELIVLAISVNLINIPILAVRIAAKKNPSFIPFVGGLIGCLILLVVNPYWAWLALLLDLTIPYYIWLFFRQTQDQAK